MAVTKSVGYPGPITGTDLSYWQQALGHDYKVDGPNDWKVVPLANGLRQATVLAGSGSGRGIRDTSTDTTVTFDPQTSVGTRWDLVVARRTWGATKATTFAVVTGGGTREGVFALRNQNPGVLDDQPVAVVPINQGADNPGTPIDARVWQANGHATALDDVVLQYINNPGSTTLIDGVEWHRIVTDGGGVAWQTHAVFEIPVLGLGLVLGDGQAGPVSAPAGARFQWQFGSTVQDTDQVGYARITWPVAYTGGLGVWFCQNGDDSAGQDVTLNPAGRPWHVGKKTEGVYRLWGPVGANPPNYNRIPLTNFHHRVNWWAIGWMV